MASPCFSTGLPVPMAMPNEPNVLFSASGRAGSSPVAAAAPVQSVLQKAQNKPNALFKPNKIKILDLLNLA
jgi:hypothetical protein